MTGRRSLFVLGIGLLGSQAGHLLAYQVRFGAAAHQLQSSGAHAYFPPRFAPASVWPRR